MEKVIFVGHGSPMNALGGNQFSETWERMGLLCGTPTAILCISAHWYAPESRVAVTNEPRTIHDFFGFPSALYNLTYPVPGAPHIAEAVADLMPTPVKKDHTWGLDHGAWSVLLHMYPADRNIPVLQLSIDRNASAKTQYSYGQALKSLREQGVLIVGSGNIVHNLRLASMQLSGGYPWAESFDALAHDAIVSGDHERVLSFPTTDGDAQLAIPTRDHFDPLCYILGAVDPQEPVAVFNRTCTLGSVSMTSYVFG